MFWRVPRSLLAVLSLICAFAARADPTEEGPASAAADSSYVAGKRAIDAGKWHDAIRLLSKAALQDDRNPDIQNLLGYAYRNAAVRGALRQCAVRTPRGEMCHITQCSPYAESPGYWGR